jgi:hypothetical protein
MASTSGLATPTRTRLTMARMRSSPVAQRPCRIRTRRVRSEANSVTDQRNRFVFSWMYEPHALNGGQGWLGKLTKGWKNSGVITAGSGQPVNAQVQGDANQDGNSENDRLSGARRNSFTGPDYGTVDMRLSRYAALAPTVCPQWRQAGVHRRIVQPLQSAQPAVSTHQRRRPEQRGHLPLPKHIGINYFPAYYQLPTNFMKATSAYAPRQLQFALRLWF